MSERSNWKWNTKEGACLVKVFWNGRVTHSSFFFPHSTATCLNGRMVKGIHEKVPSRKLVKQASWNWACWDGIDTVHPLQWYLWLGSMAPRGLVPPTCRWWAALARCHVVVSIKCAASTGCCKTRQSWQYFYGMMLVVYNFILIVVVINLIVYDMVWLLPKLFLNCGATFWW